jgi:hypothetical protein
MGKLNFGRNDYAERITDQLPPAKGGIPPEEPVFLLRAQDASAAQAVKYWIALNRANGADPDTLANARQVAEAMEAWPTKKTPDAPAT